MLYGNYCYITIENFPQKFSPCSITMWAERAFQYINNILYYRSVQERNSDISLVVSYVSRVRGYTITVRVPPIEFRQVSALVAAFS